MRMRRYVALLFSTAILAGTALAIPGWVVDRIPKVELTTPILSTFSENITISGVVEETAKTDITVSIPLVIGRVEVSVGDRVEVNQRIAVVDAAATRTALLNLIQAVGTLPEEYQKYVSLLQDLALSNGISLDDGLQEPAAGLTDELLNQLIPTDIRAPAAGVITSLSASPGGLLLPSASVGTVSDLDTLRIRMSVGEADADRVTEGDQVVFKATATGDDKYAGSVTRIFPAAMQTISGLSQKTVVGLYVSPRGECSRLKPGYSVSGVVRKGSGEISLILPYEAVLQDDANREYVYVYQNYRVSRRIIETGKELSWGVVVSSGLESGEQVVANATAVQGEGLACPLRH